MLIRNLSIPTNEYLCAISTEQEQVITLQFDTGIYLFCFKRRSTNVSSINVSYLFMKSQNPLIKLAVKRSICSGGNESKCMKSCFHDGVADTNCIATFTKRVHVVTSAYDIIQQFWSKMQFDACCMHVC